MTSTLFQNAITLTGQVFRIIIVKDTVLCIIYSECQGIDGNIPRYISFLKTCRSYSLLLWCFCFDFALLRHFFLANNLIAVLGCDIQLQRGDLCVVLLGGRTPRLLADSKKWDWHLFVRQHQDKAFDTAAHHYFSCLKPNMVGCNFRKKLNLKGVWNSPCSPQATSPMQFSLTGVIDLTCQCHRTGLYLPLEKGD